MERNRKAAALEELSSIKKKIDEGSASPSDIENRLNILHELEIIDKFATMDLIRKARVKWDIEGDENTKFFHGLINQKRQNQMINVKFQAQDSQISFPDLPYSQTLNSMDRDYLERLDIIKKDLHDFINSFFASCDMPYGAKSSFFTLIPKVNNHTLITDFRPISLIGIHYKIIAKILANRLSKVIDKIVSKEQSTFIAGLSDLDLNSVLGSKPAFHLQEPLFLSMVSLRLNSLSIVALDKEIPYLPFSSFLSWKVFIMPSLILWVMNARDLENIIRIIHVFYLASRLKINIHISNIYGIGVNEDEVYNMASNAECIAGNIPFNYLGLPIGSNMKSIAIWKMLIDRFRSRLSTWKASLLSIGGRLNLIKSVLGSLGIYYLSIFRSPESVLNDLERIRSNFFWGGNQDGKKMAWVKWPIILNSYDNGGLNIGSLKAFNLALLQKWCWSFKSTWANIVGSSNFLHSKGIILNNSFRFNAGCGTRIHFWKDIWVGEAPLSISEDTCVWNVGPNGTFTVKDARNIIDQKTLPSLSSTSWDKVIPRKVNIFMWRLSLDRLPYRLNLFLRGMDIPAISYGAKFPLSKLYLLRHLKIGYPLGMLLKKRNTGFSSFLPRFFGGFGDSEIRQFDFILDGLAPSNDRLFGQWLNALFQNAAFLSHLLSLGLFGVSSKTTSE
ncbi:hypothetical protein Tco_0516881 [Tanacetum coccineum]